MQVRVEVRAMTSDQLASFRQAVTASMGVSDDRGYSAWAGIHGLPLPISCQHGNSLFLPWQPSRTSQIAWRMFTTTFTAGELSQ